MIDVQCSIDPEILRFLLLHTSVADTEISAIGEVQETRFHVRVTGPVHFVRQTNSLLSTHLDMGDLSQCLADHYINTKRHAICLEKSSSEGHVCGCLRPVKFWFHTHPGDVFFSSQDVKQIRELADYFTPFVVAAVFNNKGTSAWMIYQAHKAILQWGHQFEMPLFSQEEQDHARKFLGGIVKREEPLNLWAKFPKGWKGTWKKRRGWDV